MINMKHLTAADHGSIEILLQERYTFKQIATKLGRNLSTVGREIKKGWSSHRSKIPNRVSIHERPDIVVDKARVGDWEGDSVLYAHTITFDNGTEFTQHSLINKALGVDVYFADPYSSWQRGANENSNRQLRAYLPKRTDIRDLSQIELDNIAWELNNKPRCRLKWHTPQEVYDWLVQNPSKRLNLEEVTFDSRI